MNYKCSNFNGYVKGIPTVGTFPNVRRSFKKKH